MSSMLPVQDSTSPSNNNLINQIKSIQFKIPIQVCIIGNSIRKESML